MRTSFRAYMGFTKFFMVSDLEIFPLFQDLGKFQKGHEHGTKCCTCFPCSRTYYDFAAQ